MCNLRVSAVVCAVLATGGAAAAQVLPPPPRTVGGVFGGNRPVDADRTHQELTVAVHLLGGYDDSLAPPGESGPSDPHTATAPGYTGIASTDVRYWRGRTARHLEATGRGYLTSYSDLVTKPLIGGEADFSGSTRLGGRMVVAGSARVERRPSFLVRPADAVSRELESGVSIPQAMTGVDELFFHSTAATAQLDRNWSRRQQTSFGYSFLRSEFLDQPETISRTQGGSLRHTWQASRAISLRLGYRYAAQIWERQEGGVTQNQNGEAGMELRKRISRTRQLVFAGGAGVTSVREPTDRHHTPQRIVVPSGYGEVRLDFARSWNVAVLYRRDTRPLEGLTDQSFATHGYSVLLGGAFGRRATVAISGGLMSGEAPGDDPSDFTTRNGTVQVNYAITRWGSLVTSYSYYEHLFRGAVAIPQSVPRRFERNSVRVGFTFWLPLYGAVPTTQHPSSRRD